MTAPSQYPQAIELKCWPISFQAIKNGTKRFEYRKDDRPYYVGVTLWQREWNPDTGYTGDELYHDVTFIIRGGVFGIPEGYCIMSMSESRCTVHTSTRNDNNPEDSEELSCLKNLFRERVIMVKQNQKIKEKNINLLRTRTQEQP